ncbi:LysR family transcriptional regulator [Pseudomonas sp. R2.Fl]|nr:LysR family transcriptional regulator [Pseudomonas sp. R2.Fl]
MDIRNFSGFVAAAELMNFTLAAQRLNMTQSALSRQIRSLEDYLGVKLFEKAGRNVRLTAKGEVLFSRINDVLVADTALRTVADDLARGDTGVLKIGACSQLIECYFPSYLKRWRQENPGIDIRIEDGGGPELAEKLKAGSVQLTVSAMPSAPVDVFETVRLGELGFLAVATREFLTDAGEPLEIGDLLRQPILTLNRRHASREIFDAACRLSGTVPQVVLESYSPHTLFSMAEGGNGIAVVPSSARLRNADLISRPLTLRGEFVRFSICAMWNSRSPLPLFGRRFIEGLGAHIWATEEAQHSPRVLTRSGHLKVV